MKKLCASYSVLLLFILLLSGCNTSGGKNMSLSIIYGITVILSLLILLSYLAYCHVMHSREIWFFILFSSVLVVNTGYLWLSISASLEQALMANRLSYLGSVLLPLSMYFIILDATNVKYKRWLPYLLLSISAFVLFVAASPGYLDIYYKEVSFEIVNGTSKLVKIYGSWHPLYLIFLFGYFIAMIITIIRTAIKQTFISIMHSVTLLIAVFVNIGIWFIEQLAHIEFEMLSISYIISELFLLGVHLVIKENKRLKEQVKSKEQVPDGSPVNHSIPEVVFAQSGGMIDIDQEHLDAFASGIKNLTQTEYRIYEAHIARATTKEILAAFNITENTLKFHNKNIYRKLGVSSKKNLLELHKRINDKKQEPL